MQGNIRCYYDKSEDVACVSSRPSARSCCDGNACRPDNPLEARLKATWAPGQSQPECFSHQPQRPPCGWEVDEYILTFRKPELQSKIVSCWCNAYDTMNDVPQPRPYQPRCCML